MRFFSVAVVLGVLRLKLSGSLGISESLGFTWRECLEGLETQARAQGVSLDDIGDVLMVGGST